VDEVVNAGSALSSTISALHNCDASPVVVSAMAVYGNTAEEITLQNDIKLVTLLRRSHQIWKPSNCPLCLKGIPLGQVY